MRKITLLFLLAFTFLGSQKALCQDYYIGEIRMFAGTFAPAGWAKCEGQILPIAQNTALFSLLGTTYGGNGTTTFALPDLRGRIPMATGQGPGLTARFLGEVGGSETNTLTINQMPAHNHQVNASTLDGDQNVPTGSIPANTKTLDKEYTTSGANTTMNPSMIGVTGGSQPVNNMQPSLAVTFIIALQGIYPPQN